MKEILKPIQVPFSQVRDANTSVEILTIIEDEIMKIGSLQHGDIDWNIIYKYSVEYLQNISKDYKVLGYLARFISQTKDPEKLDLFLINLIKFNDLYLFSALPAPSDDKQIKGAKLKSLQLMVSHLDIFNKSNLDINNNSDLVNMIEGHFLELKKQLNSSKLISKKIDKILISIGNVKKGSSNSSIDNDLAEKNIHPNQNPEEKVKHQESKSEIALHDDELLFDSLRSTKTSYFKLAEHTNKLSPDSTIGYHLRRFAIWHSITTVPEHNKEGVTGMTAISNDRLSDYKTALNLSPNNDLLKRIEKSLETSPFWFEGNHLASKCAEKLGYKAVSEQIKTQTINFVNKFYLFHNLKFNNGYEFIPESTKKWLSDSYSCTGSVGQKMIVNSAMALEETYNQNGISALLKAIDKAYENSPDTRQKLNLRLDKIRFLINEGIFDTSIVELRELNKLAKSFSIVEWEESFFNRITAMLNELEKSK